MKKLPTQLSICLIGQLGHFTEPKAEVKHNVGRVIRKRNILLRIQDIPLHDISSRRCIECFHIFFIFSRRPLILPVLE